MTDRSFITAAIFLILAACQPPAADDLQQRGGAEVDLPKASAALDSPETADAVWAPSDQAERLLYGVPGQTPLLAVQCLREDDADPQVQFTRFVRADREAQALMAIVGNFHELRLPVDATYNGRAWLWQGAISASSPDLEAMTGRRTFEGTIPGAGSVEMKPSPLVRDMINICRATEQAEIIEVEEPPLPDPNAPDQ